MSKDVTTQILYDAAQALGLQPEVLTPAGLIAIQVGGREHYVFQSRSSLNSHLACWLSNNKYATRLVLDRHGLPNIPFLRTTDLSEAQRFLEKFQTIIVKPNTGGHAQNIRFISADDELAATPLADRILEQYIEGREMRYIVLNDAVVAVQHRAYDTRINDPDIVKSIALEPAEWDTATVDLALQTAAALGLRWAAVDYLLTADGQTYTLEVNSGPGLRRLQFPDAGPSLDVGTMLIKATIAEL